MKLSRTQRWMLANQYRILEMLDKEQAIAHRQTQRILERGYEAEYEQLCQHVFEEGLTEKDTDYVLDVMEMFESIQAIYDSLEDKTGVKDHFIDFPGFCGNTETQLMDYAG